MIYYLAFQGLLRKKKKTVKCTIEFWNIAENKVFGIQLHRRDEE